MKIAFKLLSNTIVVLFVASTALGQQVSESKPSLFRPKSSSVAAPGYESTRASLDSLGIRLKDIARFRGIRSNTLTGHGLVVGLDGTGDSSKVTSTVSMLTSFLKKQGVDADASTLAVKNAALVIVTAELPAFATNGQKLDITVTSAGDAKSIRNGTLVLSELKLPDGTVGATASGAISVGGYSEGAGGSSAAKGFVTVGRIPGGGVVEMNAETTIVYEGKMYLELDEQDLTTANRVEMRINQVAPEFHAIAQTGSTIQVDLPPGMSATTAMAKLEAITVQADVQTSIIINEKTGTIVMGGDVRLSPCAIATGSLSVKIEEVNSVSQPAPLSGGTTTPVKNEKIKIEEERAQIAVLKGNTTIADLAHIFQELKLKPADIINIFQLLHQQGALKARVITQ